MSEFDPRVDYYAVLGVGPAATHEEIAKAYHALAARYHPDKHQGNDLEDLARQKLTEINAAFAVVGNPDRRARYDAARRGERPRPGGGGQEPRPNELFRTLIVIGAVVLVVFLGLRFLRFLAPVGKFLVENWRVALIVAIAAIAVFFGPRIYRKIRK